MLVWNTRHNDTTPFLKAYEQLLRTYSEDYLSVRHNRPELDPDLAFFKEWNHTVATFDNRQLFDFEGLKGQVALVVIFARAGQPPVRTYDGKAPGDLREVSKNGHVAFEYTTQVFYGRADSRWNVEKPLED